MQKFAAHRQVYIKTIKSFQGFLDHGHSLRDCTIQSIDFRGVEVDWFQVEFDNTTFLGCDFKDHEEPVLRSMGAFIYPRFPNLPYNPFRRYLYTWQELMEGFVSGKASSTDLRIYDHFVHTRFNPNINEALSQRIHDHAIDDALRDLLGMNGDGMPRRNCVGIMGGHGTNRTDLYFHKVAQTAKLLTENGYFIASGGGPGIMEAANLGAWMAGREEAELDLALKILGQAPHYRDEGYFEAAQEVLAKFSEGAENLAIPTWFYGHEPSNLFATHVAKYFSNSIREDTLLAISVHGVVFAPGSAGTTQEIFMDATQNHYGTFNYYSPMVFLGKKRYSIDTLIFPLLQQLSFGRSYHDQLFLTDDPGAVYEFLKTHPPVRSGN